MGGKNSRGIFSVVRGEVLEIRRVLVIIFHEIKIKLQGGDKIVMVGSEKWAPVGRVTVSVENGKGEGLELSGT